MAKLAIISRWDNGGVIATQIVPSGQSQPLITIFDELVDVLGLRDVPDLKSAKAADRNLNVMSWKRNNAVEIDLAAHGLQIAVRFVYDEVTGYDVPVVEIKTEEGKISMRNGRPTLRLTLAGVDEVMPIVTDMTLEAGKRLALEGFEPAIDDETFDELGEVVEEVVAKATPAKKTKKK